METMTLPTIGENSHFYGYITGLGIEKWSGSGDDVPKRLYASFEWGNETIVWIVPDHELFALLSMHLLDMATSRSERETYGNSKLWIRKHNGMWETDLP